MTKQQLLDAGLTEAQAVSVLSLHKTTIDGEFVKKHRFDEVNDDLKATKAQVAERDTQLTELKKLEGDTKTFQETIAKLEAANKEKDTQYNQTLALERKKASLKLALLEDESGKPHDVDMVTGLFDLSQVQVDEASGKITGGYKEQNEKLRTDKAFLFGEKAPAAAPAPAGGGWKPLGTPPAEGGGTPPVDGAVGYGKSLAQIKMGMMGIKPGNGQETK